MKKLLFTCLLTAAFAICGILAHADTKAISEGVESPSLEVENNTSTVNLRKLRGKYVLVDFWSSADAESRLKSNEYNAMGAIDPDMIERISVNFDRSRGLFEEIVNRDSLDSESQFYVDGDSASRIIRDFNLADGFKSYLIDPTGRIIAVNPDCAYLTRFFSKA